MKINEVTELPKEGNMLKPGNTVGLNVFEITPDERAALNGTLVYHQTRKMSQILKTGGLNPRQDISGEREFALNKTKVGKDWQTPVGIFVSRRPDGWMGDEISFEILPSDKIYRAYFPTGHLLITNPVPVERFIKKVDEASAADTTAITTAMLNKLEEYLDQLFSKLGMDVQFTSHFLDRANDARNKTQITLKELAILFKDAYIKYGKRIAQMGPDAEAVIKDMRSDINVPFVLNWDSRNKELDLVAKTVMRKKNFSTPDQELPLQ